METAMRGLMRGRPTPGASGCTECGRLQMSQTRSGDELSGNGRCCERSLTTIVVASFVEPGVWSAVATCFFVNQVTVRGVVVIGDRGTSPGNILRRIAYLEPALLASNVAVPASIEAPRPRLSVTPNPARGAVRFVLGSAPATTTTIDVIGVDGRHVAQLTVAAGGAARWDGRDAAGHPAAAGVYFARVAGDPAARATRFTLLR